MVEVTTTPIGTEEETRATIIIKEIKRKGSRVVRVVVRARPINKVRTKEIVRPGTSRITQLKI